VGALDKARQRLEEADTILDASKIKGLPWATAAATVAAGWAQLAMAEPEIRVVTEADIAAQIKAIETTPPCSLTYPSGVRLGDYTVGEARDRALAAVQGQPV
jgi:hypothetical protein